MEPENTDPFHKNLTEDDIKDVAFGRKRKDYLIEGIPIKVYTSIKEGDFVTVFKYGRVRIKILDDINVARPLARLGYIETIINEKFNTAILPTREPMVNYLAINNIFEDFEEEEEPLGIQKKKTIYNMVPYKYRYTMFCKHAAFLMCEALVLEEEGYRKLSFLLHEMLTLLAQRYGLRAYGFIKGTMRAYKMALKLYDHTEYYQKLLTVGLRLARRIATADIMKDVDKVKMVKKFGLDVNYKESTTQYSRSNLIKMGTLHREIMAAIGGMTTMASEAINNIQKNIKLPQQSVKELNNLLHFNEIPEAIFESTIDPVLPPPPKIIDSLNDSNIDKKNT